MDCHRTPFFKRSYLVKQMSQTKTIRSLLFVGVVAVHTTLLNAKVDDVRKISLCTRFSLRTTSETVPRSKRKVFFLETVVRNVLQHNHCQLWSLPLDGSDINTYFDKPSYLITDLTSESDDGKHVWSQESDDPRFEPGNTFSMEWALQKQRCPIAI